MWWAKKENVYREPVQSLLKSLRNGEWEYATAEGSVYEIHAVKHKTSDLFMCIGRNFKRDPWIFNEDWMTKKEHYAVFLEVFKIVEAHLESEEINKKQRREQEFFKLVKENA